MKPIIDCLHYSLDAEPYITNKSGQTPRVSVASVVIIGVQFFAFGRQRHQPQHNAHRHSGTLNGNVNVFVVTLLPTPTSLPTQKPTTCRRCLRKWLDTKSVNKCRHIYERFVWVEPRSLWNILESYCFFASYTLRRVRKSRSLNLNYNKTYSYFPIFTIFPFYALVYR